MLTTCTDCGAQHDASPGRHPHACPPPDPAAPKLREHVTVAGFAGEVVRIRVGHGDIPTIVEVYHRQSFRTGHYRLDQLDPRPVTAAERAPVAEAVPAG